MATWLSKLITKLLVALRCFFFGFHMPHFTPALRFSHKRCRLWTDSFSATMAAFVAFWSFNSCTELSKHFETYRAAAIPRPKFPPVSLHMSSPPTIPMVAPRSAPNGENGITQ